MTTTDVDTCIFCGQPVEGEGHAFWMTGGASPDQPLVVTARAHRECCEHDEDYQRRLKALDERAKKAQQP